MIATLNLRLAAQNLASSCLSHYVVHLRHLPSTITASLSLVKSLVNRRFPRIWWKVGRQASIPSLLIPLYISLVLLNLRSLVIRPDEPRTSEYTPHLDCKY